MAFNPYEFLWIVKESAYGTAMASPVAGTDSIYIRLAGANRFTVRTKPVRRRIGWGGGFAAPGYTVSDQNETMGNLQVELCYSQAHLLLDWACTRVNVAQTSPWTTTEQAGDLASCSVYHGIMRDDGTIKRRLYQGVKVTSLGLPSNVSDGISLLNLGLRAQRVAASDPTSGAFPAPADTAFPTDPVLFRHISGGLTVGSSLAYPESINVQVQNALDPRYFASQYLTFDRLRGRNAKVDLGVLYTASPDWRTIFEALTAEAVSLAWTNGTHTITLQHNAQNLIADMDDDLEPGKVYSQNLSIETQWDPAASEDFHFTFA